MSVSIADVCAYCRNWFDKNEPKIEGKITISGGTVTGLDGKLKNGQYFRIIGTTFNDGVYKYPATGLTDETVEHGAIWGMAIPKEFLDLCEGIGQWDEDNGKAVASPYQSESFHSYSRTMYNGGGTTRETDKTAWQGAYASKLSRWRKV